MTKITCYTRISARFDPRYMRYADTGGIAMVEGLEHYVRLKRRAYWRMMSIVGVVALLCGYWALQSTKINTTTTPSPKVKPGQRWTPVKDFSDAGPWIAHRANSYATVRDVRDGWVVYDYGERKDDRVELEIFAQRFRYIDDGKPMTLEVKPEQRWKFAEDLGDKSPWPKDAYRWRSLPTYVTVRNVRDGWVRYHWMENIEQDLELSEFVRLFRYLDDGIVKEIMVPR